MIKKLKEEQMTEWDKYYLQRDKMPEPTKLPDLVGDKLGNYIALGIFAGAMAALGVIVWASVKLGII